MLSSTFASKYGNISILWEESLSETQIVRIFLSEADSPSELKTAQFYPYCTEGINSTISQLIKRIQRYIKGEFVKFSLDLLDLSICYSLQRKIIFAEYEIPRGWISTYGRIAIYIEIPKGARVVGNALAKNPFPIIIPCHRAIRSDGSLGGYQGGIEMKRELLEMEGIEFTRSGKAKMNRVCY